MNLNRNPVVDLRDFYFNVRNILIKRLFKIPILAEYIKYPKTILMKHLLSIVALLLFFSSFSYSQDEILLNSGDKVKAIITEVNNKEVKYKMYSNPDGPLIVINKRDINKIIYKNGEEQVYKDMPSGFNFKQNIFAYHIFDVIYNQFAFSYEHISKNGNMSFLIPLSIGYSDSEGPKAFNDLGFTGFGINLFPTGQHRVTYYLGPELQLGIGEDSVYEYDDIYGYNSYSEPKQFVYGRLIINNGVAYSPVVNFRLNATFGLGIRYYELSNSSDEGLQSTAYFTISMGYAF